MGGKNVIIRDVYHVPALRHPLFSLRIHRRIPGCGYHSDNKGVLVFFPSFSLEVDNEVDNYVTCHSLGRSIKDFDYIHPRASPKSAAAGLVLRQSSRLNPPPSKDSLAWTSVRSNPAEASPPKLVHLTLSPATPEARAHQHLADPLNSTPLVTKLVPHKASHLHPPLQRRRRCCSTHLGGTPSLLRPCEGRSGKSSTRPSTVTTKVTRATT